MSDESAPDEDDALKGDRGGESPLARLARSLRTGWESYTDDVRSEADDGDVNETSTVTDAPPSPRAYEYDGPMGPVGRLRTIASSFVAGLTGREATVHVKARTRRGPSALTIVGGVFAIIGLIAVVKAAVSAFTPRR